MRELSRDYEKRLSVHPKRFEEVIAYAYGQLGYRSAITNYSRDGGIDIFLTSNAGVIGLQVKRYKQKIGVQVVRELLGSMVLRGIKAGRIVTTSAFTIGAKIEANAASHKGYSLDLIDGTDLRDLLCIPDYPVPISEKDYDFAALVADLRIVEEISS